jgi:hypothetical protein
MSKGIAAAAAALDKHNARIAELKGKLAAEEKAAADIKRQLAKDLGLTAPTNGQAPRISTTNGHNASTGKRTRRTAANIDFLMSHIVNSLKGCKATEKADTNPTAMQLAAMIPGSTPKTLKKPLDELIKQKTIKSHGKTRGTRYHLA